MPLLSGTVCRLAPTYIPYIRHELPKLRELSNYETRV